MLTPNFVTNQILERAHYNRLEVWTQSLMSFRFWCFICYALYRHNCWIVYYLLQCNEKCDGHWLTVVTIWGSNASRKLKLESLESDVQCCFSISIGHIMFVNEILTSMNCETFFLSCLNNFFFQQIPDENSFQNEWEAIQNYPPLESSIIPQQIQNSQQITSMAGGIMTNAVASVSSFLRWTTGRWIWFYSRGF